MAYFNIQHGMIHCSTFVDWGRSTSCNLSVNGIEPVSISSCNNVEHHWPISTFNIARHTVQNLSNSRSNICWSTNVEPCMIGFNNKIIICLYLRLCLCRTHFHMDRNTPCCASAWLWLWLCFCHQWKQGLIISCDRSHSQVHTDVNIKFRYFESLREQLKLEFDVPADMSVNSLQCDLIRDFYANLSTVLQTRKYITL